jgi:hypothetical protein
MIKRRSWKLGPVELGVVTETDAAEDDAPEEFRHEPGIGAASASPARPVVAEPHSSGNPRALWNQPLSRQLLAIPVLVALVWLKIWGISTWWWIVVAIAVPLAAAYIRAVRRVP